MCYGLCVLLHVDGQDGHGPRKSVTKEIFIVQTKMVKLIGC